MSTVHNSDVNTVEIQELIKKADAEYEVTWEMIQKQARLKKVHRTTAKRARVDAGVLVAVRRPREKPQCTEEPEPDGTQDNRFPGPAWRGGLGNE